MGTASAWVDGNSVQVEQEPKQQSLVHIHNFGRALAHDTNYSHYHTRFGGEYRCSGIECQIPIFLLLIIIFCGLMMIIICSVLIYKRVKYRKAFQQGRIPAKMIISGYLRESPETGKEEPDKFAFFVHRRTPDDDRQEDECPVCLKSSDKIRVWIVLQCTHQLCEKCFFRIVSRNRLHARCPLCREYLAEGVGNRGPQSNQNAVIHRRDRMQTDINADSSVRSSIDGVNDSNIENGGSTR
jgi:hypothetical protein